MQAQLRCNGTIVGEVFADDLTTLKRLASKRCNDFTKVVDTMQVKNSNASTYDGATTFVRINKIRPDNTIIRGTWR